MAAHGELSIACLRGRYRVPLQHPQPEALQRRLDRALEKGVPAALERWLRPALEQGGEGVWLIRRLETDLVLDSMLDASASDEGRLGTLIGQQVSAAIERTIHAPPDGANSLYFPTWADYAARFAADLADGGAWGAWYYAVFDGLRSLELSQALRQAITRRPEQAGDVLLKLAQNGALERVLGALGESGAQAVYEALPQGAGPVTPPVIAAILEIWQAAIPSPGGKIDSAANRLRLWVAWRLHAGQGVAAGLAAQAHAGIDFLLGLAGLLKTLPAGQADASPDLSGLIARLERAAGAEKAQLLQGLAVQDPGWLERASRVLAPDTAQAQARPAGMTACAGLFLLLPAWIDLGLDELFSTHAPTERIAAVWRYWLALKCLGAKRLETSRRDLALLTAVGLDAPPGEVDFNEAAAAASDLCRPLQRAFLQALLSQGRADGHYLAAETGSLPGGEQVGVLRDLRLDYWLDIGASKSGVAAGSVESRVERLAWVAAALGQPAETVCESGTPPPPDLAERFPDYFQKAKPAAAELAYFHLVELPGEVDNLWSLLAQATLRNFSRRLLGFAWSSAEHLYTNFLHGTGSVQRTSHGWQVELPLAPLHTVLRLVGLREEILELPWLAGTAVRLAFREEG